MEQSERHSTGTPPNQVEYFGVVPTRIDQALIEVCDPSPPELSDVLQVMTAQKKAGRNIQCLLAFFGENVLLSRRKTRKIVAVWDSENLKLCASIDHPHMRKKSITMLQVRCSETGRLVWHVFTHSDRTTDELVVAVQETMRMSMHRELNPVSTLTKADIIEWQVQVMRSVELGRKWSTQDAFTVTQKNREYQDKHTEDATKAHAQSSDVDATPIVRPQQLQPRRGQRAPATLNFCEFRDVTSF